MTAHANSFRVPIDGVERSEAIASDWKVQYESVVGGWSKASSSVIISADVDGFMSCALLALRRPIQIVGIYTTTHLLLLDGASCKDASLSLWLDHDVSQPGIRCIGQHLVHHRPGDLLPRREPSSFNPNVWQRQSWKESFGGRGSKKRDKFPFATCHFVAVAEGIDLGDECSEFAGLLAHADGAWRTVVDYRPNAQIWFDLMFKGDSFLEHLMNHWDNSAKHLHVHRRVVAALLDAGVSKAPSRAKIAVLLPGEKRELTGRQGLQYRATNPDRFIQGVKSVLAYVASVVGSKVEIGSSITDVISGVVETPYPDKIVDFDAFMLENQIFSHAFTNQRTLRFTKGIAL